jgi:hypothetical protein
MLRIFSFFMLNRLEGREEEALRLCNQMLLLYVVQWTQLCNVP